MPDFLLELFSEEIPARMQKQAAVDLQRLVTNALVERGLTYEGAKAFATPRRLALHVAGLPARQPDTREERKGPRVGSPEAAVQGFLKSAGLTEISHAKIESDPKKGAFYVALLEKPGQATLDVLAEVMPGIIRAFPWPKSMRWGAASTSTASLRWVRPLRSILATFGSEHEEPEIVPFSIDGLKAGNTTYGHRFMGSFSLVASAEGKPETTFPALAPGAIRIKRFDDYIAKLEAAKVILDAERRKAIIRAEVQTLAFAQGLEVVEDEALLEEVAGLVEWPVVLMGSFEEAFLDVPGAVIRATIRHNQKCFVLRQSAIGNRQSTAEDQLPTAPLANRFLLTANIEAKDGGKTIIAGNERVIRARLSDAKFFWDTDRKVWREDQALARLKKFDDVTFHEKLGSQWKRIERIRALAKELCKVTGADEKLVDRAARLCKADLLTEVVGEFPELQGFMGRIYAGLMGEHPSVAAACEEHYKPIGPNDSVPNDPVSITVALADKLDTLVGFWAIDEKPTGSKDPYALRRAALGVIRLVVENGVRVPLWDVLKPFLCLQRRKSMDLLGDQGPFSTAAYVRIGSSTKFKLAYPAAKNIRPFDFMDEHLPISEAVYLFALVDPTKQAPVEIDVPHAVGNPNWTGFRAFPDLLSFFHDRLKVMLRDQGARHDLVDAVLQTGQSAIGSGQSTPPTADCPLPTAPNDNLLLITRRVQALGTFLDTEDGKSLLAGFRRAANVLRDEEKKDGAGAFDDAPNLALLVEPSEQALAAALDGAEAAVATALQNKDDEAACRALSGLRAPVDAFFEAVRVNAEDAALRVNRLALLARLRAVMRRIADFSRIAG